MAYNSNIPQPTDQINVSQADILNNFTALGAIMQVDNGVYLLPENAVDPTTAANQAAFYAKEQDSSTHLFWRKESDGTVVSMTGRRSSVSKDAGWTMLPSGVVIKMGSVSVNNAQTPLFSTFAATAPIYTEVPSVMVTINNSAAIAYSVKVHTITTTGFTVMVLTSAGTIPGVNVEVDFVAIGI